MRKYVLMTVMALSMTVYANQDGGARLIDYVNPFVGTDGYGNVYPGAQIPFGGIQISPDTDEHFYDCASGYKWNRQSIQGFSLTHLSGTGIPDLGDFLFMPGTGEIKLNPGTDENPDEGYRSRFSHEEEKATPGYYGVMASRITGSRSLRERSCFFIMKKKQGRRFWCTVFRTSSGNGAGRIIILW